MYAVVRKDMDLHHQVVQVAHATLEAGIHLAEPEREPHYLIVCEVPNEDKLRSLLENTRQRGISCVAFSEPDMGNQMTAFATEPLSEAKKKNLKSLRLWRGNESGKTS